jgi:hypothetical protein
LAPGHVWTGAENLAPTGIRSPDHPARSESLYRLSYRGPLLDNKSVQTVGQVDGINWLGGKFGIYLRSETHCALRLRYVDLVVSIEVAVEVCCCFTVFSC